MNKMQIKIIRETRTLGESTKMFSWWWTII